MVFLEPFFDFTPGPGTEIKLRYADFDNAMECAKHHWECRLDLTCRKGHPLAEIRDHDGPASLCFSCNLNHCRAGHYRCLSGCKAFQVCSDCMIKKPTPATVPPTPAPIAPPPDVPRHAPPPDVPRHASPPVPIAPPPVPPAPKRPRGSSIAASEMHEKCRCLKESVLQVSEFYF